MKIGIIGTGHIGKSLVRKLSAAGHAVTVANSRGPETVDADLLTDGARAATVTDAVPGAEAVVVTVPLSAIPDLAPVLSTLPPETVLIDTSNYYPQRDGAIEAIDGGQTESLWVAEQLGRPVVKAWNMTGSHALATKGAPAGTEGRIALAVAGDDERARQVAMSLVEETGFDGVDAGPLADSWRQQPGTPAYCTELTRAELIDALAAAERARAPRRRDISVAAIAERMGDGTTNPDVDYSVRLARVLFM
ncbi:NADP oxidoreductase [Kocuria soli]|uniref:NADP oxidoreductase n=1 Tax=Kocuria soli TaxID=2485125 RepID=A0A3N3ZTQ0_9MICC|nr:NAD(P)-binding domain-containing protein [Kocuria soli]ROZ64282.1 NADP oxidoreductase [Kocuria soli]